MRHFIFFIALLSTLLSASFSFGVATEISDLRQYGENGYIEEITGIVVMNLEHMDYHMGRFHIQSASGELWGGIIVVDEAENSGIGVLARGIHVGDSVTLCNVYYEENGAYGNDALYFKSTSTFSVVPNVGVPAALEVDAEDIFLSGTTAVGEEYQSMRVKVSGVSISQMNIGKKSDNYELVDKDGMPLWAADYANSGKVKGEGVSFWKTLYHHYTCPDSPEAVVGDPYYNPISDDGYGGVRQHFASVEGIMEKTEGSDCSYYQLLTLSTESFEFAIPGDANDDGTVDGSDATILAGHWQSTDATWWDGDFNEDGVVDGSDATILAGYWQQSTNPPAPNNVPEPATWTLMATLLLFSAGFRFIVRR